MESEKKRKSWDIYIHSNVREDGTFNIVIIIRGKCVCVDVHKPKREAISIN